MPRLATPRPGERIPSQPHGFPLFFEARQPRVVTADPWAFFDQCSRENLSRADELRAHAYVEQAYDFFQAAENPQIGSRPLLYYYSFMNLAKVALLNFGEALELKLMHGLADPRANERQRLQFSGQEVEFANQAHNNSQLFPEFLRIMGGDPTIRRNLKVVDLLYQVPSIHRTFTRVSGKAALYLPVRELEVRKDGSSAWVRMIVDRDETDAKTLMPKIRKQPDFAECFTQVQHPKGRSEIWFETKPLPGKGRGVETAIRQLGSKLYCLSFSTLLTSSGYRTYYANLPAGESLHPLVSIYAAMFYLGSVTRYKPDVFDKIVSGGYAWVVEEFLATAPTQFLYALASAISGGEVVRPYSAVGR